MDTENPTTAPLAPPALLFHGSDDALAKLTDALAKASESFDRIPKDRTVTIPTKSGPYTFSYSPLSTIMKTVRPALLRNGLVLLTPVSNSTKPGHHRITAVLMGHGARIEARIDFDHRALAGNSIKDYGTVLTYLRRYATQGLLAIEGDLDADELPDEARGEGGSRKQSSPSEPVRQSNRGKKQQSARRDPANRPPHGKSEESPFPPDDGPPGAEAVPDEDVRVIGPVTDEQQARARLLSKHVPRPDGKSIQQYIVELSQKHAGCLPQDLDSETCQRLIEGMEAEIRKAGGKVPS